MHFDHSFVHNKSIKAINKRVKSFCFLLQTFSAFSFSVLFFFFLHPAAFYEVCEVKL